MKQLNRSRIAGVVLTATMAVRCSASVTGTQAPLVDASMSETAVDAGVRDSAPDRPTLGLITRECRTLDGAPLNLQNYDIRSPERIGRDDAPIKIVWYSNMTSQFDYHFYNGEPSSDQPGLMGGSRFRPLNSEYIATGRVQLFVKYLPLQNEQDEVARSSAVVCAGMQGRAFDMVDVLLGQYPGPVFNELELRGFDRTRFSDCMTLEATTARVRDDRQQALEIGITGSPNFIVYSTITGECVGVLGNYPYQAFRDSIEAVSRGRDQ